ncbi:thioredoxin family protein [Arcobacter sp. LA11]|uniref:thioredoxin family protein n=1 Tax=Arcobacter sp. LA11 TaxID=1898176 RepID=UPI000932F9A0|nr:thioredoxin family protein [Arcobacter sp. LA11]
MKRIIFSFLVLISSLFAEDFSWQEGLDWQSDFDETKQLAKYHDKLIFMFLESRTCFYCPKLKKEVFSKKEFKDKIKKHFIPVILDNSLDADSDVANTGQCPPRLTVSMTPAIYFMGAEEEKLARRGKKHMIIYGMWQLDQMLEWMDDAVKKHNKLKEKGMIK